GPAMAAAEVVGRFDQALVNAGDGEGLDQDDQRHGQGQKAHHGRTGGVEDQDRLHADQRQQAVEDAAGAEDDLPGVGAHRIAGEEGDDQQQYGQPLETGRNL